MLREEATAALTDLSTYQRDFEDAPEPTPAQIEIAKRRIVAFLGNGNGGA